VQVNQPKKKLLRHKKDLKRLNSDKNKKTKKAAKAAQKTKRKELEKERGKESQH
jgi:hypothetical protein